MKRIVFVILMLGALTVFMSSQGCVTTKSLGAEGEEVVAPEPAPEVSPEDEKQAQEYIDLADDAMAKGNYESAVKYFKGAAALDPTRRLYLAARIKEAEDLQMERSGKEAIKAYKEFGTEMTPTVVAEGHILRAEELFKQGIAQKDRSKINGALNLLTQALKTEGLSPTYQERGWADLGNFYWNIKEEDISNINKSIDAFESCMFVNPGSLQCEYGIASGFLYKGRYADALEKFRSLEGKVMKTKGDQNKSLLKNIRLSIAECYDNIASASAKLADSYRKKAEEQR